MNATILFVTIEPIEYRRRVLNQIAVAQKTEMTVEVYSFGEKKKIYDDSQFSFPVHRIMIPINKGALKFIIFNMKLLALILFRRFAIIHFRGLMVLPAILLRQIFIRSVLIYDAHEYYAGHQIFADRPLRRCFWLTIERLASPFIDLLLTVSEPLADLFRERYPRLRRVEVIRSLPEMNLSVQSSHSPLTKAGDDALLIFHGYFLPGRALDKIIAAMSLLTDLRVKLLLIGEGPLLEDLQAQVKHLHLEDRVSFRAMLLPEQLIPFIAQADIGLSIIEADCLNRQYALPNKFFEYIMAGVPVLASNIPTLQYYVDQYQVGRTVEAQDAGRIAETIKEMLADPGQLSIWKENCRRAARELNWNEEAKKLLDLYGQVKLKRKT